MLIAVTGPSVLRLPKSLFRFFLCGLIGLVIRPFRHFLHYRLIVRQHHGAKFVEVSRLHPRDESDKGGVQVRDAGRETKVVRAEAFH